MFMSIYIHIPFCNFICTYCDFCKIIYDKKYINRYLNCLYDEIKTRYNKEKVRTIYIGGGTPSSLSLEELTLLMEIVSLFDMENEYEFTVECNVESLPEDKPKIMKRYGVNRISLGVPSFDEGVISFLGRRHSREMVFEKINLVKKYFDNISIDLIYAAYEDISILKRDIEYFLKLDIGHVSFYSLMIEAHTVLKINGNHNISEDLDYEMYNYIEKVLEDNGYIHYEISNYARDGYQSKHNIVYWDNLDYYGFGLSSTSYINGVRMVNTKNLQKYLEGNYTSIWEHEEIDVRMENEVMLKFRKFEGTSLNSFYDKYGVNLSVVFNIDDLIKEGYLVIENGYLKIDKKYMYISMEIVVRMIK